MSDVDLTRSPRPRISPFRFRLSTLLILMTVCCFYAAWWFFPRPVKIVALLYAQNTSSPFRATDTVEFERQRIRLIEVARSDAVIQYALSDPEIQKAADGLVKKNLDVVAWHQDRIEIDFPSGGDIMRWTLTVDQSKGAQGARVLQAIIDAFLKEWPTDEAGDPRGLQIIQPPVVAEP